MPQTREYVEKELKGIEFFGYNKVGDNTYPNLMAILTGSSADELFQSCIKTFKNRFDNCSFIWENFHQKGYATGFAEEMTKYGLFTYNKNGFNNVPVMHYWETFAIELESNLDAGKLYQKKCNNIRPSLEYHLDYTKRFITAYNKANIKYFGLFWESILTHDTLNYDKKFDEYYLKHLKELKENNFLNDTVMFFMSDHGIRFGKILETYQGRMEERLPFFYVILPDWFKEKYPEIIENLNNNSRSLTTPFDLHKTMQAIMDEDYSTDSEHERGISLFKNIPDNRTCESSGIPEHFCTCKPLVEISVANETVIKVTNSALQALNYLTKNETNCAVLNIDKIMSARVLDESFVEHKKRGILVKSRKIVYTVLFTTLPGNGLFDATVECTTCTDDFVVAGHISRLNLYGTQSWCVHDSILKLYCYCKSSSKQ